MKNQIEENMKATKITFWIITALVAALFIFSGSMAIIQPEGYAETIASFNYPAYFPSVHGPLKIAAAITLLIPRSFVFKHWAYCGVVVTLLFASLAHQSVGEPFVMQLAMMVLAFVSYFLYVKKINLKPLM